MNLKKGFKNGKFVKNKIINKIINEIMYRATVCFGLIIYCFVFIMFLFITYQSFAIISEGIWLKTNYYHHDKHECIDEPLTHEEYLHEAAYGGDTSCTKWQDPETKKIYYSSKYYDKKDLPKNANIVSGEGYMFIFLITVVGVLFIEYSIYYTIKNKYFNKR